MNDHYYVYVYLRKDGTPYYIGKGKGMRAWTKGKTEIGKPTDNNNIIILESNLSDEDAKALEIKLIKKYGRIDTNTGILRNKTDGSDGVSLSGNKNPMYGRSGEKHPLYGNPRLDMIGDKNPMYGKTGKNHPAYGYKHANEFKEKLRKDRTGIKRPDISNNQKGNKNPMYGKTGKNHPSYGTSQKKYECVYCTKMFSRGMLTRWHNDKCKNKKAI